MCRLLLAVFPVVFVIACSSDGGGNKSTPQNVASWRCCAIGDCTCHEETPNSGMVCSKPVDSCTQMDGGPGCCVAAFMGDAWECDCSAAGAECPTPGGGNCFGDCPTPTNVQSVPSCPP